MLFTSMIQRLKKKRGGERRINISSLDDVISNEKYTKTAANNCLTEEKKCINNLLSKARDPE